MKYWSYFVAKLLGVGVVSFCVRWLILNTLPIPKQSQIYRHDPFSHDLLWTTVLMGWFLLSAGLVWLAILDQRFRCRTCLRRLRMPVATGSWSMATLFAPPKMEYICPYGHGTMKQPQVQIAGRELPAWQEHDDNIWRELEQLEGLQK